jgi:hypothetical protein
MDGVALLIEARSAGLAVAVEGGRLVIRGPRRAEPVARKLIQRKPEVVAALRWGARHHEALVHWGALHPPDEAAGLAWSAMQTRWHLEHGERVPRHLCAGCRRPIAGSSPATSAPALDLIDRCRLHDAAGHDCLIRYGERWRDAATRALVAMGLSPPVGWEDDPLLRG